MKKSTKIILASVVILLTGVGAYFLFREPKPDKNGDDQNGDDSNGNGSVDDLLQTGKIGRFVRVKDTYANTRESQCTTSDLVVKAEGNGTAIGEIKSVVNGCGINSENKVYKWYYISLTPDMVEASGYKLGAIFNTEHSHAYVREDVVTID